jgi:hypothetical protein
MENRPETLIEQENEMDFARIFMMCKEILLRKKGRKTFREERAIRLDAIGNLGARSGITFLERD